MATYKVTAHGREFVVTVVDTTTGGAKVTVDGETFHVEPAVAGHATPAASPPSPSVPPAAGMHPSAPDTHPTATAALGDGGTIVAPIPGVITAVCVKPGESVGAGQIVLKLEAMKMENDIATPTAGTVKEIAVREGSEVGDGQLLMVIG